MNTAAPIEARFALRYPGFDLDVDLRLPAGGVSALFGPSGSGKTSCLRCFAGLESGCEGRIVVAGDTWQDSAGGRFVPPHRRRFGLVFQDARLFPHLTVRGNLRYAMDRAAGPEAVGFDEVVRLLDIADLLERQPDRLSGGERQRCAIARALLTRPSLLLLDEPLAGLSRSESTDLTDLFRAVAGDGVTVLLVEHDVASVLAVSARVVVLDHGSLLADGTPEKVAADPSVRAAYLGEDWDQ